MIYTYPNCPNYCEICKNYYGEIECIKCKPERVKVGSICKCKDKTNYEDNNGNCVSKKYILLTFYL